MRPDSLVTGGNSIVSITLGKDLEIGHWILDTGKEGIDRLRHAELMPEDLMAIPFWEYAAVTQHCISFWTVPRSVQNALTVAADIFAKDVPVGSES